MTPYDLFGLLSTIGIGVALILLGLLSKRLGKASKARPHAWGFTIAAGFLFISAALQLLNILVQWVTPGAAPDSPLWVVVYNVLPAVGVTIGLLYTWHYWSWLLAESG